MKNMHKFNLFKFELAYSKEIMLIKYKNSVFEFHDTLGLLIMHKLADADFASFLLPLYLRFDSRSFLSSYMFIFFLYMFTL